MSLLLYLNDEQVFYFLLAYTGIFAFGDNLNDFYTLNFLPERGGKQGIFMQVIDYYLSLFPVFTISASFPIIGKEILFKNFYFLFYKKRPLYEDEKYVKSLK